MQFLRKNWLLLTGLGLAAWWFFTGDTPLSLVSNLVTRGQRLSSRTYSGSDVVETVDELVGQAVGTVGREVSEDAYVLATVLASEHEQADARRTVPRFHDALSSPRKSTAPARF